jgi:glycogen debranching enzyme
VAPRGRRLLLNHADSFAVFDEAGDIPLAGRETYGLFCRGTRFLDRFELRLNGDFRDTISLQRRKVLVDGALFETLQLQNYGTVPLALHLAILFSADFADIFELRGVERAARGTRVPPRVVGDDVVLAYLGLDGVEREARLAFSPLGWTVGPGRAEMNLEVLPGETSTVQIVVRCRVGEAIAAVPAFAPALALVRDERIACTEFFPIVYSNNEGFNDWVNGSLRDIALLRAVRPTGSYVNAGIPWFATVFGRDGLITAIETLAFAPELAAGTLRTLAALQGRHHDPVRDEEPGKILHELRDGEMAATGEVPFGRYYGSVDATPLFIVLLAAYADRTADLDLVHELWPAAQMAMGWVDQTVDARGYLGYDRRTPHGLANQGWKDSHDSVSHADGRLADPPIALCEVQGYVYAARRGLAALARRLGSSADAERWEAQATALREAFARDFWLPDEGTYALALDGTGRPCEVVASNAGHCLFTGIA